MLGTYRIRIININTNAEYELTIQEHTLMSAFRVAKDHAQYVAGWEFSNVKIQLLTNRQNYGERYVMGEMPHD